MKKIENEKINEAYTSYTYMSDSILFLLGRALIFITDEFIELSNIIFDSPGNLNRLYVSLCG